jgi:hypothetical protein
MNSEPIFIVGAPRSGTTLLAAMLGAHSRISCGPETHFFRWLSRVQASKLCSVESWPGPAVEFVCSISYRSFSDNGTKHLVDKYNLQESDIARYLANRQPSVAAMLGSITEPYMIAESRRRWAEKTPDHLEYVGIIRNHFPTSPIIRIVRDPRDVALSLSKVSWGTNSLAEGLLHWKRLDEASQEFFRDDVLSYSLRFEDLIAAPQLVLGALCKFLGEEFEEGMLDTSRTGKKINTRNVPWKDKASQPVDASRLQIWRNELETREKLLAEAILGDRLDAYHYQRESNFDHLAEIYPGLQAAIKYAGVLADQMPSGFRFWKSGPLEEPDVKIFLGDPENDNWLGRNKLERLLRTVSILVLLAGSYLKHKRIFWITTHNEGQNTGFFARFVKRILLRHGTNQ